MTKTENAPAIFSALAAIMKDVEAIGKDRKNESQGYKFRGIDDVYNALNPLLARHGVFTVPEVIEAKRDERTNAKGTVIFSSILTMKYTFFASDGSSVQAVVIGEGMDSGDKATNKAMAVAHKYALLQIFAVPTEDAKDPEVDHHEVTPKRPTYQTARISGSDLILERATEHPVDAAVKSEMGGEEVPTKGNGHPSKADMMKLSAAMKKRSMAPKSVMEFAKVRYGTGSSAEMMEKMTHDQYDELLTKIIPGLDSGSILALDATPWPKPLANEVA